MNINLEMFNALRDVESGLKVSSIFDVIFLLLMVYLAVYVILTYIYYKNHCKDINEDIRQLQKDVKKLQENKGD